MKLHFLLLIGALFGCKSRDTLPSQVLSSSISETTRMTDFVRFGRAKLPSSLNNLKFQMDDFLSEDGGYAQTIIPFSDAPAYTDLLEPRVIYASRRFDLFLATIARLEGPPDFEWISFDREKNQFDFGIIENFGTAKAEVKLANRDECIACHRNGGPLLMRASWQNTAAIDPDVNPRASSFLALILKNFPSKDSKDVQKAWPNRRDPETRSELMKKMNVPAVWNGASLWNFDVSSAQAVENLVAQANSVLSLTNCWKQFAQTNGNAEKLPELFAALSGYTGNGWSERYYGPLHDFKNFLLKCDANLLSILSEPSLTHLTSNGKGPAAADENEFLAMHEKKRAHRLKSTVKGELASEQIEKSPCCTIMGSGTTDNFHGVMDSVASYWRIHRMDLALPHKKASTAFLSEQANTFIQSPAFKQSLSRGSLPVRSQLASTLKGEFAIEPSPPKAPAQNRAKPCADCHANKNSRSLYVSWDIGNLDAWKKIFYNFDTKKAEERDTILYWATATRERLTTKSMPPAPHLSHLTEEQRILIIDYLKTKGGP